MPSLVGQAHGLGREGLKYAIDEMTEIKLVCFNFWRP
jgi:hypothetical protein